MDDETKDQIEDTGEEVDLSAKVSELEAQIAERDAELEKLKDKDLNFSKFRQKTKHEQEAFKESLSAEQKILLDEIQDLRTELGKRDDATLGKYKEETLNQLSGGDEKLKERIEAEAARISGEMLSKEAVAERYADAAAIVERKMRSQPSVTGSYIPTTSDSPWGQKKKTNHADTDEGKNLAKELGLTLDDPNKK